MERRAARDPWLAAILLLSAFAGPVLHAALLHLHQARFHHGAIAVSTPVRPTALQNLRALQHHATDADHDVSADRGHDQAPVEGWIYVEGSTVAAPDAGVRLEGEHVHPPSEHRHDHEAGTLHAHDSNAAETEPAQPHSHGEWTHSHSDTGDDSLGELAAGLLKIFAAPALPGLPAEWEVGPPPRELALHLPTAPRKLEIPPPRSVSI